MTGVYVAGRHYWIEPPKEEVIEQMRGPSEEMLKFAGKFKRIFDELGNQAEKLGVPESLHGFARKFDEMAEFEEKVLHPNHLDNIRRTKMIFNGLDSKINEE